MRHLVQITSNCLNHHFKSIRLGSLSGLESGGSIPAQQLFSNVKDYCSGLQDLVIRFERPDTSTMSAFTVMLQNLRSLTKLSLYFDDPSPHLSVDMFRTLGLHQSLRNLRLKEIHDKWVIDLMSAGLAADAIFPRLEELGASISDIGFHMLAPFITGLKSLGLPRCVGEISTSRSQVVPHLKTIADARLSKLENFSTKMPKIPSRLHMIFDALLQVFLN